MTYLKALPQRLSGDLGKPRKQASLSQVQNSNSGLSLYESGVQTTWPRSSVKSSNPSIDVNVTVLKKTQLCVLGFPSSP